MSETQKCEITRIGSPTPDGGETGWGFKAADGAPGDTCGIRIGEDSPPLLGGYTIGELREIRAKSMAS